MIRKRFFFLSLITILILCSTWMLKPFSSYWQKLDESAFFFLNNWIATNPFWQKFWAIINHKQTDWVFDIVMLSFFIPYIFMGDKKLRITRAKNVLIVIACIGFTIIFFNRYLAVKWLHLHRLSPSLVFEDAPRLSDLVPWIKNKVTSRNCFPADHGTTACLFAISVFLLMGRKIGILATIVATFFILPRLIVGAHWLSDVLVGALSIALFSMGVVSLILTPKERHAPKLQKNP